MSPWILRYTIGTQVAGRFRVTALLMNVGKDGWPIYRTLKVEPI